MQREEIEQQSNNEAKQGWRFAADAARITDENASSEDSKHSSGGVFVAVDSNLGAVIDNEEGAVTSISGNEGRIAQSWVNVSGGVWVFPVYFWHSEVVKQVRTTRHSWLIACDANMSPEDFEKNCGFKADICSSRRQEKKCQLADSKVQKGRSSKGRMIMSLQVAACRGRSGTWKWWNILNQGHIRQSPLW